VDGKYVWRKEESRVMYVSNDGFREPGGERTEDSMAD